MHTHTVPKSTSESQAN